MTPLVQERTEAIWGPIGRSGVAQLAELSDNQLRFLLEFLRAGRELQER